MAAGKLATAVLPNRDIPHHFRGEHLVALDERHCLRSHGGSAITQGESQGPRGEVAVPYISSWTDHRGGLFLGVRFQKVE